MMNSSLKRSVFAIVFFCLVAQQMQAVPIATYDISNGNITFNGFESMHSVRLFSAGGYLVPSGVVTSDLGFGLTERTSTLYSWADLGAGVSGNGLDAGNIVQPGTPVSDLMFDYTIGLTDPITPGPILRKNIDPPLEVPPPIATYHSATGNVMFDSLFGVNSLRLASEGGNFFPDSGNSLGFPQTEQSATFYSWDAPDPGMTGTNLDAGNFIVPNTEISDLTFDYLLEDGGVTQQGSILLDDTPFNPIANPRPSDGSTIDLTRRFLTRGRVGTNSVWFRNDGSGELEITDVTISNDEYDLFSSTTRGQRLTLTLDIDTILALPPEITEISADLFIETNGGSFDYALSANIGDPPRPFDRPTAIYNITTGNITFDGLDGINTLRFFSATGNLIPVVGNDLGFALTEKIETLYSWAEFGAGVTGDFLDAGNIVRPGTDVHDLGFDYSMGLLGHISSGLIIVVGDRVPEPGALVLIGFGLLCVTAKRERCSQQSLKSA